MNHREDGTTLLEAGISALERYANEQDAGLQELHVHTAEAYLSLAGDSLRPLPEDLQLYDQEAQDGNG